MFTAYDLAKPMTSSPEYKFGMEKERLVKELRAFAELVEKDIALPQRIEVRSTANVDDFPMTVLRIIFYNKE